MRSSAGRGLAETAVETFVSTFPMAVFGAGAEMGNANISYQMMTNAEVQSIGWNKDQMLERGFQQDKSGNWYQPVQVLKTGEIVPFVKAILAEERGTMKLPEPQQPVSPEQAVMPQPVEGMPEAGVQKDIFGNLTPVTPQEPPPPTPPTAEMAMPAPDPTGAVKRVFDQISFNAPKATLVDKIRKGFTKAMVTMVDDLYALDRITKQAGQGGLELSIEENPYMLARLLRGVVGKAGIFLEEGTFGRQFYKREGNRTVPNYTGESLSNILKDVSTPEQWQDFSTYLTSKRAVELSERGLETGIAPEDAREAISELEQKHGNFPELSERVYKYQNALLNYMQESGLISTELLSKLRESTAYVPFYRVLEELEQKGYMGKKMANIAKPIKRIKGSERMVVNPLESIIKNTYAFISASDRNYVGVALANLVDNNPEIADVFERVKTPIARVAQVTAKELGIEVGGLTPEETEQVFDIFRPSMFTPGDEVTVLIDGKKNYFRVDADLKEALLNLNRESLGSLVKLLSLPAKWLRAGAVLSPDFMARNPTRDTWTAFIYSNYGFLPGIDFIRGIAGIIGKDTDYQLFKASGAEMATLVSVDREYMGKTFKEIVSGKKFTDYIKNPLELLQIVSGIGETATRLGEFKAALRAGATPLEAGYSARDVTVDFAKAGTTARALNSIIAFFNANIRGWDKMITSFKEHPVRTASKAFIGITLPSILLWLNNHDDDRWKEIPQWQKDLFWIILTKDNIYRIPKPFDLGILFGSVPERYLDWLETKDPRLIDSLWQTMVESGSPGLLPTGAVPIIENLTNYSFFKGQEIVPDSRKDMPPELQYTRWTSETAKKMGELLNYSPAKIDNLINGWTGGLGRYAVNGLDVILKKTGISPDIPEPTPELADMPVIRAFVVRNPYGSQNESVDRFYDLLDKYQEGEKYLKEMLELGQQQKFDAFKTENPELLFFMDYKNREFYSASARYLRTVARELSELRKKEDEIYQSATLSPELKREKIDAIDMLKVDIVKKALDLFPATAEPKVIESQITDALDNLGNVINEAPVLSLEGDDYYNTNKLDNELKNILKGVSLKDLEGKQIPAIVSNWYQKQTLADEQKTICDTKLTGINDNIIKGDTFEEYYKQWQERLEITDPELLKAHEAKYPNANLGNITKRQLELLRKYHNSSEDEQKRMIEQYPELAQNPKDEWLKANPRGNAVLAVWGEAKILTKEAYDEYKRLIEEFDIVDPALPKRTLPPDNLVDTHFKYLEMAVDNKYNSAEVKLLLWGDHQKAKQAGQQSYVEWAGLEIPDDARVPIWTIDAKYRQEDSEYETIKNDNESIQAKMRAEYLSGSGLTGEALVRREEYRMDRRRRDAYGLGITVANDVENFVLYYELPTKGFRRERLLIQPDNERFANTMSDLVGIDLPDPDKIPDARYDDIYDMFKDKFDVIDNLSNNKSPFFVPDAERRKAVADSLRRTASGELTNFGKAEVEREAYGKFIPNKYIKDYVSYYSLFKPKYLAEDTGTDLWFEDDWFMMEHPRFYKEVYIDLLQHERLDFLKVPSRDVYSKYLTYLKLATPIDRQNMRVTNLDLDEWLVDRFGYTSILEQKRRTELTTSERWLEEWTLRQQDVQTRLTKLRR